jgi:exonuclease 3'-5' domain-containing protein 1
MEKAHDISLDEPCVAHQAILFMLDVLMRNNKPLLTLAELYDSFGDKSFTPQMLRAVGGNEQGLKQFILRYPSLFTVNGDNISANSGGLPRPSPTPDRYLRKPKVIKSTSTNGASDGSDTNSSAADLINSSSSSSSPSANGLEPQYESKTMKEIEQEAIAFFRKQISKREEDWLPIVSVAGHASQSSSDVRKYVGPQNEFKAFLLKYPHIFVVREEYCGLKGKADLSAAPFPPPSPPPKRRIPTSIVSSGMMGSNGTVLTRNHSFKSTNRYSACPILQNAPNSLSSSLIGNQSLMNVSSGLTSPIGNGGASLLNSSSGISSSSNLAGSVVNKPRLTPVEVKAVHYVMRILHKNGRMLLQTIPGVISRAPDQVSNIVGFTREDLIQFFKRHSAIFQLHPDGCVSVKQDAVKALILKDGSNIVSSMSGSSTTNLNGADGNNLNNNPGIITNNGVVLRIFPKYGILNMDNNEQVFFDIQSCQFETFSDLTTILHMGDRLYFNAIIGPRDGSTKWRSLKTWIKMKPQQSNSNNNMIGILDNMSSHSDADKSDDSSTSSSHGGYNARNFTNGSVNGFGAQQPQPMSTNGASYYLGTPNGGQVSPTIANNGVFSVPNSASIGSISNLASNVNAISEEVALSASTPTGLAPMNVNGEFNQYQLESSTGNSANEDNLIESTLSLNSSISSSLIHSSSVSNLQQVASSAASGDHGASLSASKSIHSFSTPTVEQKLDEKSGRPAITSPAASNSNNTVTKLMKQSPDNISQREVCPTNSERVSIGCQTISTGEVAVTNVYIE